MKRVIFNTNIECRFSTIYRILKTNDNLYTGNFVISFTYITIFGSDGKVKNDFLMYRNNFKCTSSFSIRTSKYWQCAKTHCTLVYKQKNSYPVSFYVHTIYTGLTQLVTSAAKRIKREWICILFLYVDYNSGNWCLNIHS